MTLPYSELHKEGQRQDPSSLKYVEVHQGGAGSDGTCYGYPVPHPQMPQQLYGGRQHLVSIDGNWGPDLCGCCAECIACCEVYWLPCITVSLQYNTVEHNHPRKPHVPIFFLAWCCPLGRLIITMMIRTKIRDRYRIEGSICEDYMAAWCCNCCALTQQLRQMSMMNDYPGRWITGREVAYKKNSAVLYYRDAYIPFAVVMLFLSRVPVWKFRRSSEPAVHDEHHSSHHRRYLLFLFARSIPMLSVEKIIANHQEYTINLHLPTYRYNY
eukprot:gene2129-1304_t